MIRRAVPLFLLLAVLLLAGWQPARSEGGALTIDPTEFGMAFVNSAQMPASGTRIARGVAAGAQLDRFPLYWDQIETSPGNFNWAGHDAVLAANEAQGLGTLAILLGTPGFYYPSGVSATGLEAKPPIGGGPLGASLYNVGPLRAGPVAPGCAVAGIAPSRELYQPIFTDGSDHPGPGKSVNPANHWANYVARTVDRYRPGGVAGRQVRYWEIWNEPDLCHFWGGTSAEYARLLKVAYLVIQQVDPQATVIVGGLAQFGEKYSWGHHFLNEFVSHLRNDPMAASHGGFFDAIGSHHYSNVVDGYNYTRRIQNAFSGTGWENKPIWVTESGVPVCGSYPGPDCPSPYRATAEEQAAYIWQNIAYTRIARNNGPIFHFMLHDDGGNGCVPSPPADAFGLVTNEPGHPCVPHSAQARIGYTAFQLATQYLSGTELLWADIQDGKVRRVAFYDPLLKERRLLIWAITGSAWTGRVAAADVSARRIDLNGSVSVLTPVDGQYAISLAGATNQSYPPPDNHIYTIGGRPYLLVERDTQPPINQMDPLPPISLPSFEVRWNVSDLGSGVTDVGLWVRTDEGPWTPWLSAQGASGSAFFSGANDHRYRFGIVSEDRAGNRTLTPAVLAETVVGDGAARVRVSGQVLTTSGAPAPYAGVLAGGAGTFAGADGRFSFLAPFSRTDVAVQGKTNVHDRLFVEDATLTLLQPPPFNPVVNGDFESGLNGWTVGGTSPVATEIREKAVDHRLRFATQFVGSPGVPGDPGTNGGNATISQPVTIPTGAPWLALALEIDSSEPLHPDDSCSTPGVYHDKFEVILVTSDNQAHYIYCSQQSRGWGYLFVDVSPYAGQQVTLIFNLYQSSAANPTSALLDQILIGTSPPLSPPRQVYGPVMFR